MDTRKFSSKQEARIAKLLNGHKTANSGATLFNKGDVIIKDIGLLIECKTSITPRNNFSIKEEWLLKLKEEAFSMGASYVALSFDFGKEADYFIIDSKTMKLLIEYIKTINN